MNTDIRLRSDEERARRWLQRRLVWEETLATLRQGGRGRRIDPAPQEYEQEPAAA